MNGLFVLYSDFNCPFCYALHERLHDLKLLDRCEWRGVQHAPQLPRPMKPWSGSLEAELRHEVAVVQRLAPGLPIALPPGKPNTGPAIEQAVQLLQLDRNQGMNFVRTVYQAFWQAGKDISESSVLKELAGYGVMDSAVSQIHHLTQDWAACWYATGRAGVPLIVSPAGDLLVGCMPEDSVRRFFA